MRGPEDYVLRDHSESKLCHYYPKRDLAQDVFELVVPLCENGAYPKRHSKYQIATSAVPTLPRHEECESRMKSMREGPCP